MKIKPLGMGNERCAHTTLDTRKKKFLKGIFQDDVA
jgi:hypothetical protein